MLLLFDLRVFRNTWISTSARLCNLRWLLQMEWIMCSGSVLRLIILRC